MTPELQTVSQQTAAAAATAAGQYVTKVTVLEPQVVAGIIAEEDDSAVGYYQVCRIFPRDVSSTPSPLE